jgi:hypothetical protein
METQHVPSVSTVFILKHLNFNCMKSNILIFFLVKLGFKEKTVPQFIAYARNIIKKMTGNADFPSPEPALPDYAKAIDELDVANQDALNGGSEEILIREQKFAEAKVLTTQLGAYVELKSKGDVLKIASAGFDYRKQPQPLPPLEQVKGLAAVPNVIHGMVDLRWKKVTGARIYAVMMTDDIANNDFKLVGKSSKTKFSVLDLNSGKQYWFKVMAIGTGSDGAESDPATTFVL